MDSSNSDEHRMLKDTIVGLLSANPSPTEVWTQLCEFGMVGLTLPESLGGADLGLAELMLIAQELGRGGVDTPFMASEVLALPLVVAYAQNPILRAVLPDVLTGKTVFALADVDGEKVSCATRNGQGYHLTGSKQFVMQGAVASHFVVSAMLENESALFIIPTDTDRLTLDAYAHACGDAAVDVCFADVDLPKDALLVRGTAAVDALARAQARGVLCTAAAMVAAMETLLDQTTDYLRTRRQFGVALSSFQVLQHSAVDMYVELELARAMLDYGQTMMQADAVSRGLALDAVKVKINEAARIVGE
ncbi:MAG: hypothetical protein COB84_08580, partial [Rhodobacteraceae bacterium]